MTSSDLADAFQILNHFTNFGQGYEYREFPVRCFVRYRFDSDAKWKTFWERKRNGDELDLERDDSDWEDDDELKGTGHAETYVIRRIQKEIELIESSNDSDDNESGSSKTVAGKGSSKDNFPVDKYYYTCYPHVVHLHYPCRKVTTHQFDQQRNREVEVKCFHPTNILFNTNKTFTCYNPQSVTIGKKEYEPDIVTCEDFGNGPLLYWEIKSNGYNWNETLSSDYRNGKVEVEIYLNTSPCNGCFEELKKTVEKNENLFIHVKYASFYKSQEKGQGSSKQSFLRSNFDEDSRLKVTPFTSTDWRVVVDKILKLAKDRMEKESENILRICTADEKTQHGKKSLKRNIETVKRPLTEKTSYDKSPTKKVKHSTPHVEKNPAENEQSDSAQDIIQVNDHALANQHKEKNEVESTQNTDSNEQPKIKATSKGVNNSASTTETDIIHQTEEVTERLMTKVIAYLRKYLNEIRTILDIDQKNGERKITFDDWRPLNRQLIKFSTNLNQWMKEFRSILVHLRKFGYISLQENSGDSESSSNSETDHSTGEDIELDICKIMEKSQTRLEEILRISSKKTNDILELQNDKIIEDSDNENDDLELFLPRTKAQIGIINEQTRAKTLITQACAFAKVEIAQLQKVKK